MDKVSLKFTKLEADEFQVQNYVEENVPAAKRERVVVFFDMFDAEEGRL